MLSPGSTTQITRGGWSGSQVRLTRLELTIYRTEHFRPLAPNPSTPPRAAPRDLGPRDLGRSRAAPRDLGRSRTISRNPGAPRHATPPHPTSPTAAPRYLGRSRSVARAASLSSEEEIQPEIGGRKSPYWSSAVSFFHPLPSHCCEQVPNPYCDLRTYAYAGCVLSNSAPASSAAGPPSRFCHRRGDCLRVKRMRATPQPSWAAAGSSGPLRGLGSRSHPCPRQR